MRKFMLCACAVLFLCAAFHEATFVHADNPITPFLPGDFDNDGTVGLSDIAILETQIANNLPYDGKFDMYADGVIDQNDVYAMRFYLVFWVGSLPVAPIVEPDAGTTPPLLYGDCDSNGIVDQNDLFCLAAAVNDHWAFEARNDLLQDGHISNYDLLFLAQYLLGERSSLPVSPLIDLPDCECIWQDCDCMTPAEDPLQP